MPHPTGFSRHILWGVALLVCFALALVYTGTGLAFDWLILSALAYWHLLARHPPPKA